MADLDAPPAAAVAVERKARANGWRVHLSGGSGRWNLRAAHTTILAGATLLWVDGKADCAYIAPKGVWEKVSMNYAKKYLSESRLAKRRRCPRGCGAEVWVGPDNNGMATAIADVEPIAVDDTLALAVEMCRRGDVFSLIPTRDGVELHSRDCWSFAEARWPAVPGHVCGGEAVAA